MVEAGAVGAFFDGVDGKLEIGLETFLTDVFRKSGRTEGFF